MVPHPRAFGAHTDVTVDHVGAKGVRIGGWTFLQHPCSMVTMEWWMWMGIVFAERESHRKGCGECGVSAWRVRGASMVSAGLRGAKGVRKGGGST